MEGDYRNRKIGDWGGKSKGSSYELNTGLEFGFFRSYFVRFGYSTLVDAGAGVSFGLGAIYKYFSIDYALSSIGDFGYSHKISLSFIN